MPLKSVLTILFCAIIFSLGVSPENIMAVSTNSLANSSTFSKHTNTYETEWERMLKTNSFVDMKKGAIAMHYKHYPAAANFFAKGVIKNPKEPMAYVYLGGALYWMGQVDQAMAEFRHALKLDPKNAPAYQLMAIAYAWKGDMDEALKNFKLAEKYDPTKADNLMDIGSVYFAKQNYTKALDYFRKAIEQDKRHPLFRYQIATLYEIMGRDKQAEKEFKRAITLFRYYQDAALSLATLYEKMGNKKEAEKYYKRAIWLKPGDSIARLRYTNLLLDSSDSEKLRKIIQPAFYLSPNDDNGIKLSFAYSGGKAKGEREQQLERFKQNISKISANENVEIDTEIVLYPKLDITKAEKKEVETSTQKSKTEKENNFQKAYKENQKQNAKNSYSIKRQFFIPANLPEDYRQKQIQNVVDEISSALKETETFKDSHVSISVKSQGMGGSGGLDGKGSGSTTSNSTTPKYSVKGGKAAYNPRVVGNELGLWVMGRGWLKFAYDIVNDVEEKALENKTAENYLVLGLNYLVLGEGYGAYENFLLAIKKGAKIEGYLGAGAAQIIMGDENLAIKFYKKVLEIDPKNKIASKNLQWLHK